MQEVNLIGIISAGGSVPPVIESKTITENGTYNTPSGVDGFNPVVVNVPTPQPVIQSKNITENGTYNVPSGVDGFNPVVVNVASKIEGTLIVTENGTFTPEDNNHVWNEAIVNVNVIPVISSNAGKFKLGIINYDDNMELALTFTDATINTIENMDIFTNQKLPEGIDRHTLKLCKAYDSAAQTNAIGWVGFYQNTIRAWNIDQSQNILLEHFYCTLFLSDSTTPQDNPYINL